jgi:hypothetical protein
MPDAEILLVVSATIVPHWHPSVQKTSALLRHVHSRHRRREIVRMSLIPPPHTEGYASYFAVLDEPRQLPPLELLKSLDDLDEEEDEDEDEDLEDLDEEEDEDDLDEDYDDDDEDEDDDEEDEDEDGGVKPLKMAPFWFRK